MRLAEVEAPPYDVVSTAEAVALAEGKPFSFLRVVRPELELEPGADPHDELAYERSAQNLDRLASEVPFVLDESPGYYLWRLTFRGRSQTGFVGLATVDEYESGIVRRHERTRPDKEDDRVRHILATSCHTEPVFLAHRDHAELDAIAARTIREEPLTELHTGDGVDHTIWKIASADAVAAAFRSVPVLYIADGHHRSAAAARVARQLGGSGESEAFLAVTFPSSELEILPYNRLVRDLGGRTESDVLTQIGKVAELEPSAEDVPRGPGEFALRLAGGAKWWRARLRAPASADPVARLDVSRLQDEILSPILGIGDPRTDPRIDFVGGIRGPEELVRRLSRDAAIVFSMHPTALVDVFAVADAGGVMPPKSTWFEPKLRSGFFLHRI